MKTITALRNLKKCKSETKIEDHYEHQEIGRIFQRSANPRAEFLQTGHQEERDESCPVVPVADMLLPVF